MQSSLNQIFRRVAKVKPWVALALLLTVGLVVYYSIIGMRYWDASRNIESLVAKEQELSVALQRRPAPEELLDTELRLQEDQLKAIQESFAYLESDDLMALLSETATESGVELLSIAADGFRSSEEGSVRLQTQPMTLSLNGETADVYQFLSSIYQKIPISLSDLRISGLDGRPSVQINLVFYLNPNPAPGHRNG